MKLSMAKIFSQLFDLFFFLKKTVLQTTYGHNAVAHMLASSVFESL